MSLYLAAHRAHVMLPIIAALCIVTWLANDGTMRIPQLLSGGSAPVAVPFLCATGVGLIAAYGFGCEPSLMLESIHARRLWPSDLILVGLSAAPVGFLVVLTLPTPAQGPVLAFACASAVFVGGALFVIAVAGQRASVVLVLAYFMVAATLGGTYTSGTRWWAPVRGTATTATILFALGTALIGFAAYVWRARRRVSAR